MNKAIVILVIALLGCAPAQEVVKTSEGTFRKIRAEGKPNKSGAFEIELWAKDGVPTNQYVYIKRVFQDNSFQFTRTSP